MSRKGVFFRLLAVLLSLLLCGLPAMAATTIPLLPVFPIDTPSGWYYNFPSSPGANTTSLLIAKPTIMAVNPQLPGQGLIDWSGAGDLLTSDFSLYSMKTDDYNSGFVPSIGQIPFDFHSYIAQAKNKIYYNQSVWALTWKNESDLALKQFQYLGGSADSSWSNFDSDSKNTDSIRIAFSSGVLNCDSIRAVFSSDIPPFSSQSSSYRETVSLVDSNNFSIPLDWENAYISFSSGGNSLKIPCTDASAHRFELVGAVETIKSWERGASLGIQLVVPFKDYLTSDDGSYYYYGFTYKPNSTGVYSLVLDSVLNNFEYSNSTSWSVYFYKNSSDPEPEPSESTDPEPEPSESTDPEPEPSESTEPEPEPSIPPASDSWEQLKESFASFTNSQYQKIRPLQPTGWYFTSGSDTDNGAPLDSSTRYIDLWQASDSFSSSGTFNLDSGACSFAFPLGVSLSSGKYAVSFSFPVTSSSGSPYFAALGSASTPEKDISISPDLFVGRSSVSVSVSNSPSLSDSISCTLDDSGRYVFETDGLSNPYCIITLPISPRSVSVDVKLYTAKPSLVLDGYYITGDSDLMPYRVEQASGSSPSPSPSPSPAPGGGSYDVNVELSWSERMWAAWRSWWDGVASWWEGIIDKIISAFAPAPAPAPSATPSGELGPVQNDITDIYDGIGVKPGFDWFDWFNGIQKWTDDKLNGGGSSG